MNIALVHYWMVRVRGGENVLHEFTQMFPDAPVYTHVFKPSAFPALENRVETTSINSLPFSQKVYPLYTPLMFRALEQLDFSNFDLIISSEAGPAKGIVPGPNAAHVSYVHSPMRYIWDQKSIYRKKVPGIFRPIFDEVTYRMRSQDLLTAARVDKFVANSHFVSRRIWRYYKREAEVLHPPVYIADLEIGEPHDYYLFAGHASGYKRLDIAIEACERLQRRLIVIGDTPRSTASKYSSATTTFLGRTSRPELINYMKNCKALLFPGIEDFGILPLEVMGCGRPVIAYGRGGALETVIHGETGILFDEQTATSLMDAIMKFEASECDFLPSNCVSQAKNFTPEIFRAKFGAIIHEVLR